MGASSFSRLLWFELWPSLIAESRFEYDVGDVAGTALGAAEAVHRHSAGAGALAELCVNLADDG